MNELGFVHQHCIFHLYKNILEAMQSEINKTVKNYKQKLKIKHPELSDYKIKKLIKDKKICLEQEIKEYLELFYELFNQQNFKKAIRYIDLLKNELKGFPKPLAKYLNKNFFPEYRKFLKFLENPFKEKLERTNNKLENYLGNTLDKHTKRIYRTPEGMFAYIMSRKNGWIENRNQDLTN